MQATVLIGAEVVCDLLVLPTLRGIESIDHIEPSEILKRKFRHDSEVGICKTERNEYS